MGWVFARVALVALVVLALYGLGLLLLDQLTTVDIRNPLAISWTGAFAVGLAFAAWNAYDSVGDVLAAIRRHRPARVVAGGQWLARSNSLQGLTCAFLTAVGLSAILQWGPPELRAGLLLAGGLALIANQVWNRLDRERLQRLPFVDRAQAMEQLASELAGAGRQMGHDVNDHLAAAVIALELVKGAPCLTDDERACCDGALASLLELGEAIRIQHQRIRALDPSGRESRP